MENYFNIRYEFDREEVWRAIDNQIHSGEPSYICVADGVILNTVNRDPEYLDVVNGGLFSICDSGYVPLYLSWIYGVDRLQYSGSDIFQDAIEMRKYKMCFLGGLPEVIDGLKCELTKVDPRIDDMLFYSLPFKAVEDFNYEAIARMVEESGAEIIWVALGAPKQEKFINRLRPHLKSGVMIAVGAVFNFRSGVGLKRAPNWMVKMKIEFVYRIFSEPKKQLARCWKIISSLPTLLIEENRRKKYNENEIS